MTTSIDSEAVSALSPAERRERAVGTLKRLIEQADPGTVAALRRMSPEDPPPAFFRLATGLLDEVGPAGGSARDDVERKWALVARTIAAAVGLLGQVHFGAALAFAGVTERRVLRLLEARGNQLDPALRGVVQHLVSKGQAFNPFDVARLVLSEGGKNHEAARRSIARDFYRHEGAI